jgi:hypothetical protein
MSKTWLKEVLEENRKELDSWPDWKKSSDPTGSQKQSEISISTKNQLGEKKE